MSLVGRLLFVAGLAAIWWVITRSTMVTACTLVLGSIRVIQDRRSPTLPLDGLILSSVVVAVGNLYLERTR